MDCEYVCYEYMILSLYRRPLTDSCKVREVNVGRLEDRIRTIAQARGLASFSCRLFL